MQHAIPELDPKGLREFGLITGGLFAALFGLFFPWLLSSPSPYWPWIVGAILALWALAAPATMRGFYRQWMRSSILLGRVTTPVVLGVVFFAVITPVAVMMRLAGRDTLARRLDRNIESYRIPASKPPKTHMERPF